MYVMTCAFTQAVQMIWYLQTDTHWYRQLLIQIHRSRLERKIQSERALYLQSSLVSIIIRNTWRHLLVISYLCLQWQYVCLHAHYLWRGGDVLSICRAAAPGSGPGQAPNRHRSTRVRAELRWSSAAVFTLTHFFSCQGPECNTFSYSLLGVV